MSGVIRLMLAAGILVLASQWATAQTAFEQLEQQVRTAVGQPANGPPAAGQPAVAPPAAAPEPGYLGLIADDRQTSGKGIRIMEVVSGGPAEQAGLKTGDLITRVDHQAVPTMNDFARAMNSAPAGAKLSFEVQRDDKTQVMDVTLGSRPPADQRRFQQFGQIPENVAAPQAESRPGMLGVRIAAVTPEMQQALHLPSLSGALIVSVVKGTPADKAGIQAGAAVVSVDGRPVERPGDLTRAVAEAGAGRRMKLGFYQQGVLLEREVTLDAQTTMVVEGPIVNAPASGVPANVVPPAEPSQPIMVQSPASDDRVQQLQQRVEELERKVRELEQTLKAAAPGSAKP